MKLETTPKSRAKAKELTEELGFTTKYGSDYSTSGELIADVETLLGVVRELWVRAKPMGEYDKQIRALLAGQETK